MAEPAVSASRTRSRQLGAAGFLAGAVAFGLPVAAAATNHMPTVAIAGTVVAIWAFVVQRYALSWDTLIGAIAAVILFVPIGRYTLPVNMPFQLEPYRLLVILVAGAWLTSLLIQSDTRLRPTGFGMALTLVALTILASVVANANSVHWNGLDQEVLKSVTFFASFLLVVHLVSSSLTTHRSIDKLERVLVGGGTVVALSTIVEARIGFNVFNHLQQVCPLIRFDAGAVPMQLEARGEGTRAIASAQHPIALGAALALLVPLAASLAVRSDRRWWGATGVLVIAVFATVSRTAIVMLLVEAIVLVCLKPRAMIRLWPLLLPCFVMVHIAAPGVMGGIKSAFFPSTGLVAEQSTGAGTYGSGRLADVGPTIREWKRHPLLGRGFGTRITDRSDPLVNASILDDQWLASLSETGVLGVLALVWLFMRSVRRFSRAARRDPTDRSWTLASIAAAITAFAVGMFTYDAFSFTQATFLMFILLGIGAAAMRLSGEAVEPATAPVDSLTPTPRVAQPA
jgi:hypothetical protein